MKKIFLAGVCMLMSMGAMAQESVKFFIDDFTIQPGEKTTVAVNLTNPDNKFCALQFDLQLPEGVAIASEYDADEEEYVYEFSLNADRANGQDLQMSYKDGVYTFIAFSMGNKNFKGTEGAIVNLGIAAAAEATKGQFEGKIAYAKLTPKSGTSMEFTDVPFKVTIGEATGINNINADEAGATVYNLAGQRVMNARKGIFIQNGKLVIK